MANEIDQAVDKIADKAQDVALSAKGFIQSEKTIVFERVDIINLSIVLLCGIGLVASIYYGLKEVATALAGGLVGYLSKNSPSR